VPETYCRWIREASNGFVFKRVGRSRLAQAVRDLIHRISGENKSWGHRRICGELKKLGIPIGASTVRKVMVDDGLEPPPYERAEEPPIGWKTFIDAHMDSMVACDFFTKNIYSVFGVRKVFVLVFIHMGSRKVFHSFPTERPTHDWVIQQCRNASMWLGEEGLDAKFLIRDRDVVYPERMKEFWNSEGVQVIRTPVRTPKANAFCESFIGTYKRECLNHFTCFRRAQLNYICKTWFRCYNTERPHRGKGIDNNVLDVDFNPTAGCRVKCKQELGGIIKSYYREAA
jgi:putative transposase